MSDLKITHAGTVQTQDRQGPMNPYAPFGQGGSLYVDDSGQTKPPLNQVYVAITIVQDDTRFLHLLAEDPDKFITTAGTGSHSGTVATSTQGTYGQEIASGDIFPIGLTIYGRWTAMQLADGAVIAYIG